MKKMNLFVLAMLIVLALLGGCVKNKDSASAQAKDVYVVTLCHSTAITTSLHIGMLKFQEEVEKKSGGRIKVNIYPASQMGGDREIIEGTQTGQVTMMASSNAPQVNFVRDAVIFDLPFVYPNIAVARKTLSNPEFLSKIKAAYAKSGFLYMGTSDQGFRTLTANKEIHTPSDVQGLTIRTMENKYHMTTWRSIGANPTPIPFNELYTALQQKTADAQENPIELIHSQKFYEQQKFIIRTNHTLNTIVWIMNKGFYDGLPADLKQIVDDAAMSATDAAKKFQDENVASFEKQIKDYGCTFIELNASELNQFEQKAKQVWDLIKADCDAEVYNAFMAALDKAK